MRRALGAALAVAWASSRRARAEAVTARSPRRPRRPASTVVPTTVTAPGGPAPTRGRRRSELALSGGDGTVFDTSATAFALPLRGLSTADRRAFAVGNNFFNDNWVTAPASTEGRDGLGPTFNAQSCSSCHFHDGRAEPPDERRRSRARAAAAAQRPRPGRHAAAGPGVRRPAAGPGHQRACRPRRTVHLTYTDVPGRFADGTPYTLPAPTYEIVDPAFGPLAGRLCRSALASPRRSSASACSKPCRRTWSLGRADADDADGDGISGRPNHVVDVATGGTSLGRFGWKANVPTVEQQIAGAFHGDIGITTPLFPEQNCPPEQTACLAAPNGGTPEVDEPSSTGSPSTPARSPCPPAATSASPRHDRGRAAVRRAGVLVVPPSASSRRATSDVAGPERPDDPSLHRPAAARHGPRPGRRPARRRGHRRGVAHPAAVGHRARPRP